MTEAQKEAYTNWYMEVLKNLKFGTAKSEYNIVQVTKLGYICMSWKLNNNPLIGCFQINRILQKLFIHKAPSKKIIAHFLSFTGHIASIPLEDQKIVNAHQQHQEKQRKILHHFSS